MTHPRAAAYADYLRDQYGTSLTEGLHATAAATAAGDWKHAAGLADRLRAGTRDVHLVVIQAALAAGVDWWTLGEILSMHPQAAFLEYANLVEGLPSPAEQRPELAVVCTAGLVAAHGIEPEYGIDLDDLDPAHSLTLDPTTTRLRAASKLLGGDIWITVTTPGDYEGAEGDPEEGQDAITQWTTVVVHPDELVWLREALALNATDDEDDLEPLD